ncbi:MAG: hypothetical protein B6D42_02365 [Anaerolineae bacterium UTCFX5]|jgi:methyl-accepting chemotaxis protein|nr:MAG: hypothetical protein B6D42_02365 [Anaerolineae bacterium UTCFX5]
MIRLLLILLVVAYLAVPVGAGVILFTAARDMIDTVSPVYESASESLNDAADRLGTSMDGLKASFQPIANTINSLRNRLSEINSFIRDNVNAVIEFINNTPGVHIPLFEGITIPAAINVNFLTNLGNDVSDVIEDVRDIIDTTREAVAAQTRMLGLGALLIGVWLALTQVLVIVAVVRSIGR